MASAERSKKLRVLLMPFFATSHIGPCTDLAVRLAAARPDVVEPTLAVTPANVSVVRSALRRHGSAASPRIRSRKRPASHRASRTSPPPATKGGALTPLPSTRR